MGKPLLKEELKNYNFDEHLWGFKKMRHLVEALIRWATGENMYSLLLHKTPNNEYLLCVSDSVEIDMIRAEEKKKPIIQQPTIERTEDPPEVKANFELRIII